MAKFCKACGNALEETDTICKTCGKEVINDKPNSNTAEQPQPQVTVINNTTQTRSRTNGMAVAGFVISLVSLLCCGSTSFIGLILSIIGLVTAKNYDGNGKGLAIAGIIISSIFTVIGIISIILSIAAGTFSELSSSIRYY